MKLTGNLSQVPDWLKTENANEEIAEQYRRLMHDFSPFSQCSVDQPVAAVATRCLLIHEWRRVLLRSDTTSLLLLPQDWPAQACHQLVASLYQHISPQAQSWLDDHALPARGCVSQPSESRTQRFQ